jgi:hypothetical protein
VPSFNVLGVEFGIEADSPGVVDYTQAFLDAYADHANGEKQLRRRSVTLRVKRQPEPVAPDRGVVVPIHRSKHAYWSLEGRVLSDQPRVVAWPSRRISVSLTEDASEVDVFLHDEMDQRLAGESVFHVLRSLAL